MFVAFYSEKGWCAFKWDSPIIFEVCLEYDKDMITTGLSHMNIYRAILSLSKQNNNRVFVCCNIDICIPNVIGDFKDFNFVGRVRIGEYPILNLGVERCMMYMFVKYINLIIKRKQFHSCLSLWCYVNFSYKLFKPFVYFVTYMTDVKWSAVTVVTVFVTRWKTYIWLLWSICWVVYHIWLMWQLTVVTFVEYSVTHVTLVTGSLSSTTITN